jgi:hypothetical protein
VALLISEEFDQLHFTDSIQHHYEVIRPIVLFADSVAARSASIGVDRATVSDHARRFVQQGMSGLVDQRRQPALYRSTTQPVGRDSAPGTLLSALRLSAHVSWLPCTLRMLQHTRVEGCIRISINAARV